MRLFVWPLILTLLLILGLSELVAPIVQRHGVGVQHTLPIHKTLYLTREIYDDQIFHITEAAMEWREVTNGDVVFDIKMLPRQDITWGDSIIVMNVTPDEPEIILLDVTNRHTTLGLYNTNNGLPAIELVDERITEDDYTSVVLHEMGHSLGLEHPDTPSDPDRGMGSLMYSSILFGNRHVTTFDLKQFCHLYHCDWKKYHGFPQIQ